MRRFLDLMRSDTAAAARIADARPIAVAAESALDRLANATNFVVENASEPGWAGAAATDYLRLFALSTYGWLWAKMAVVASRSQSFQFARQKLQLARFFSARILPQTLALEASILAGAETILHPANDEI